MKYEFRLKPKFCDFDCYGIIHHSVYYQYLEEARIEAFEYYFNGKLESYLEDENYVVVMDTNIKYLRRIDKREYIKVCLDINMRNGTYVFCKFSIMDDGNNTAYAKGTIKLCFVDKNYHLLLAYPEKIRQYIKENAII